MVWLAGHSGSHPDDVVLFLFVERILLLSDMIFIFRSIICGLFLLVHPVKAGLIEDVTKLYRKSDAVYLVAGEDVVIYKGEDFVSKEIKPGVIHFLVFSQKSVEKRKAKVWIRSDDVVYRVLDGNVIKSSLLGEVTSESLTLVDARLRMLCHKENRNPVRRVGNAKG